MNDFTKEVARLRRKVSKLPPLPEKEEKRLDMIADLLVEDFWDKFNTGKLHKPEKHGK